MDESIDACSSGLKFEANNSALKVLLTKAQERKNHLAELETTRREREVQKAKEAMTLRQALKARQIRTRTTDRPPEMPEAAIALEEPLNSKSALSFPVMLLYPVHAQTDFIKQFWESESLNDHLSYILPLPWDDDQQYSLSTVECYMETTEGGLIKAGKKLRLLDLLSSGKLEVVNGLVKVNVVPKAKAVQWIEEFKTRRGKT